MHDSQSALASHVPATRPVGHSFDAVDTRAIQTWLAFDELGLELTVSVGEPTETRETYYDTDDWRIHRAGLTLSFRESISGPASAPEAVMEPLPREDGSAGVLLPVSQRVDSPSPDALLAGFGPATDRVQPLARSQPLEKRFEVQLATTTTTVSREGDALAMVHLTRITIPLADEQRPARLHRVVVEAPPEHAPEVDRLIENMTQSFGLRPTLEPRYFASLHALGITLPGPPDAGSTAIDHSMTVGEVAMAALRRQFLRMLHHEPGTRLGEDPEELHDMRVAIRRMRAAVKLFAPYLPARALPLRRELSWVGAALGEVRDLDVQIAGAHGWASRLEKTDREAFEGLIGPLVEHRVLARHRMIRALDSKRYERLVRRMTATLARGPLRSAPSHRVPVLAAAPVLIERCYDRVEQSSQRLKKSSPPEKFHRARIRFKALRYALEFHRDVYGKACDDAITMLVGLQDLLGKHQDAEVATTWLHNMVKTEGRRLSPATIFAAGKVSERYARRSRRLRRRFPKVRGKLQGRHWTRFRREMKELQRPFASLPAEPRPARGKDLVDGPPVP